MTALHRPAAHVADAAVRPRARHLLLVEDEPRLSQVLTYVLTDAGYGVTPCKNGLDALARVERGDMRPDLVISDIGLPGLRGDRLAAELRRIRPTLPILLMTGFSSVVTPEDAAALGVAAVLEKPIALEDLLAAVEEALRLEPRVAEGP